jgi:nucleoid-associated protein EbfC
MGSGFAKMKKQARMLEEQVGQMRQKMQNTLYTGTSGNGLVTVTINGAKELQTIAIQPACVDPQDVEGLQDLIKAACENAYSQIAQESSGMGSMGLPFGL